MGDKESNPNLRFLRLVVDVFIFLGYLNLQLAILALLLLVDWLLYLKLFKFQAHPHVHVDETQKLRDLRLEKLHSNKLVLFLTKFSARIALIIKALERISI